MKGRTTMTLITQPSNCASNIRKEMYLQKLSKVCAMLALTLTAVFSASADSCGEWLAMPYLRK
jgi:hypothetical protein